MKNNTATIAKSGQAGPKQTEFYTVHTIEVRMTITASTQEEADAKARAFAVVGLQAPNSGFKLSVGDEGVVAFSGDVDTTDLSQAVYDAAIEFERRVEENLITYAKQADEAVGDIAHDINSEYGFGEDSEEAETIRTVLFAKAGDAFPGDW